MGSHCYYAVCLITELYVCITDLFSLSLPCSLGVVCVRIKISLLLFHCMILSILFRFRFLAVNIACLSHDVSAIRVCTIKSLSRQSYHLPDLNNVIFSSTGKHPRLDWIPTKVRNLIGMTSMNELHKPISLHKVCKMSCGVIVCVLTKSSGGPSSASSDDRSSLILAKSQTMILRSLPAVARILS